MSHGLETLEHQSAPESTRGLFDNYSDRKPTVIHTSQSTDRHRSLDSSGRRTARQSLNPPSATRSTPKTHQRSRSASASDMGYFGTRRNHLGLQTLTEEGGGSHQEQQENISNSINKSKPMPSSFSGNGGRRESITMDSLKDMINTLKSIPPTSSISTSSLSSSGNVNSGGGRKYGHRKQQSLSSLPFGQQQQQQSPQQSNIRRSYNDGNSTSDMHSVLQSKVQELRSISTEKATMMTPPRPSSSSSYRRFGGYTGGSNSNSNSGSDDDMPGRDAALAEAEAKLVGSFMSNGIKPSSSFSSSRRRSSDSSTDPPLGLHKRTSLQQLATLSEETGPLTDRLTASRSFSALSKRTQFNKPLDLYSDESNKHKSQSRRGSRNVDMDWRSSTPSLPLAQSTSPRQSFNLVPFTPTRVNFARDDANPHQRRPLFIAHLPFSALTPLFRTRQLVRGMLRVNKRNRSDAYVYCEELDADIYIAGSRDRNRALEGDVVAVRLIDVDKVLQEKREKEEAKLVRNAAQARIRLPDEEDENEIIFGGDEDVEVVKPKFCGVIVAILERAQNQVFSGTLTLIRPNNKRAQDEKDHQNQNGMGKKDVPRIVWFKATDKRVPLIAIPIEQTPDDFVENSQKYATRLFVGSIKRWPITSLHPFGTLEKELGSVFELETQTKAIYADNNVTDSDFSEAVYNCLPPGNFEASVDTPSTTSKRRDFTNTRCFTIDPKGSNVLDDAFSIEKLENGSYEIGVHISDVTYFIKPHSALDKEARTRGVRVDLLHSHVPMVPEIMTEKMTNLIPNHVRFTFSVVWKINAQGKILDTWFGKSTIRSCAQLTMDDAQTVIDGGSLEAELVPESHRQNVENDIRSLAAITTELYNLRHQSGILTQMRDELAFDFQENYSPTGVSVLSKPIATHHMVKELLLLANISVAQKISSRLPEQALLRRHAAPVDRKIRALQQYCSRQLGVQVDIGSAGNLEKSIEAIKDVKLRKLVSVIVLKTLKPPKYFCAGTYDIAKYSHYSLNVPLFTHFTAPSRRFADILVHRQLEFALSSESEATPFYLDRDTVQKLTQHCNVKKEAALYAREQSSLLFLGTYLNKMAKQNGKSVVYREATVVAVSDGHVDVMVGELNMEKRVHLANLPVWRSDFDETKQALTMYWRKGVDTSTGKQRPWSISDDDDEDDEDQDGYLDEELLLEEMLRSGATTLSHPFDDQQQTNGIHPTATAPNDQQTQQTPVDKDEHKEKETIVKELSVLEQYAKKAMVAAENNGTTVVPSPNTSTSKSCQQRCPEATKSSTSGKRASLVRARLSDSTAYSTEQGYQTVKALDKIRVALVMDMVRTPPLIRILAVNPFA